MWRELASEFPDADIELQEPATPDALTAIEEQLGQPLPAPLRELLTETDGIEANYGTEVIWTAEKILEENLSFRGNEQFRNLYMPFDALMFFGDNGGGDQFAFVRTPPATKFSCGTMKQTVAPGSRHLLRPTCAARSAVTARTGTARRDQSLKPFFAISTWARTTGQAGERESFAA
ncbi:SMI1/KNR4 family protein [Streptomyces dangxiongensis]|uniref:SMI1/KNR4 family protein n=1 Tax=Streptomyces dangxiongensis TaxID=1442032 RepID=UPI00268D1355